MLKARREYIKFITELATNMANISSNSRRADILPSAEEYFDFIIRVSMQLKCHTIQVSLF